MQAIDFIGDIHGYATPLKALLTKLGYTPDNGVWSHPKRKACFLGDYIDRGDRQLETVRIIQAMVGHGSAHAIMGNHELNAIAWVTAAAGEAPTPQDRWLRPHNARNLQQHQAFLQQAGEGTATHIQAVEWFKTLPLWIDFGNIRAVHACWNKPSMETLKPHLDTRNRLKTGSMSTIYADSRLFDAIEILTKGMEAELPEGCSFADKDGHVRTNIRLKWWLSEKMTYRQAAVVPEKNRPDIPDAALEADLGYKDSTPIVFGHYWMSGTPGVLTAQAACLDYSIAARGAKDRKLCAYRWSGEQKLKNEHFVWVSGDG